MNILDFCRVATMTNQNIKGKQWPDGTWSVYYGREKFKTEYIKTQRGEIRKWKSLDVMFKHLNNYKLSTEVSFTFSNQIELI